MRTSLPILATAATAFLGAGAINLKHPRRDAAPRVVQHDIQRRDIADPLRRDQNRLRKRQSDKTVRVALDNEETLYFMNVTIGTPEQELQLHLDTGSSDLWVNVDNSKLCMEREDPCSASGTYNANASSSYSYIDSTFNISYVDGSGSVGDYVSDTVRFGGITLEEQQFGVGYVSSSTEGILGIGYPINEVAVAYNGGNPYPNVPWNLVKHGEISSNAYSLWLNDLSASTGSILFGGINTAKFQGELQTLPIIPENGVYAEFVIALTDVGANGESGAIAKDLATPVLLDSGSSLMYLPDEIAYTIFDSVDATYQEDQGAAIVDCALRWGTGTIDFTFSGPTISVGLSELVITVGTENGEPICIIGILPAEDTTPVLGDTFLRSAYVVYDLDNHEISMAPTNFNATGDDNIMEIGDGDDPVPSATVVPNAVTDIAVKTGGHVNGGSPTGIDGGDGSGIFGSSTTSSEALAVPKATSGYSAALIGALGVAVYAL
ncbi:hypothetical protein Q7P37_010870 [Cladosporium fusiforme]